MGGQLTGLVMPQLICHKLLTKNYHDITHYTMNKLRPHARLSKPDRMNVMNGFDW